MNKISEAFAGKKAFAAYLMAGDPTLAKSARYLLALQEGGADLIEVGIPFSDPIAEGAVIEQASVRALSGGTTLDSVFTMMESLRGQLHVPVVFMTYLNPVFVYGYERFLARSRACGIAGLIIPDLPFEEQGELKTLARDYGIDIITMAAPTSGGRIRAIADQAEGFVYLVSSMGVTGVRGGVSEEAGAIAAEIKRYRDIPVAVGFGVAEPEQAAAYARMADGVIVGSAIVRQIAEDAPDTEQRLQDYVRTMKAAMNAPQEPSGRSAQ